MDLGKAKLRKVGINNLLSGIHPQHGVIWTDGKGIFLAPIQVEGTQIQNATSARLGEFEQVTSVHWSKCESGVACHLCVVHQNNVTVWRVSGALPKLSFKQVRKINVRPIAQGCLWNPGNDVLCLLSRHQCSFYYRHDSNKASYAFPAIESGKISCGCWSPDGKKLVLCVGSTLLVYRWDDLTTPLDTFTATAWPIPGLDGQISSIAPVMKDSVVVAAEVPLESLCKQHHQQDLFNVSETNGIICQDVGEDGIIRPGKISSVTQSLLNIQQNTQATNEARSTLTLVHLQDGSCDPIKLSSSPLRGILTPDILLYEKSSQCVVVGSNSQSQLHIFALLDKHLAYCGDIQLEKSQRPKGLCAMPTYFDERGAALLILVGQRATEDASFLSSTLEADFHLSLKYIILKAGYETRSKHGGQGKSLRSRGQSKSAVGISKSESMKEHRLKSSQSDAHIRGRSSSVKADHAGLNRMSSLGSEVRIHKSPIKEFVSDFQPIMSPNVSSESVSRQNGKIIQDMSEDKSNNADLEMETTSFSAHQPAFRNTKLVNKFELTQSNELPSSINNNSSRLGNDSRLTASQPSVYTNPNDGAVNSLDRRRLVKQTNRDNLEDYKKSGLLRVNQSPLTQTRAKLERSVRSESTKSDLSMPESLSVDLEQSPNVTSSTSSLLQSGASPALSPRVDAVSSTSHTPPSPDTCELSVITERRRSSEKFHEDSDGLTGESKSEPVEPLELPSRVDGDMENVGEEMLDSDRGLGSSVHSADSSFDSMEKQVKIQKDSIEALQKRLEDLALAVEKMSCVSHDKYQDMSQPEMIKISCDKSDGQQTKMFLLDNGRLQLEPIKVAFGLATVELLLDGIPCILGANIDGYIPMKFSSSSSLTISGLPKDKTCWL